MTLVNFVIDENAFVPIVPTFDGIVNVLIAVLVNASVPIEVIDIGIVIDVINTHDLNAYDSIDVIPVIDIVFIVDFCDVHGTSLSDANVVIAPFPVIVNVSVS